MLGTGTGRGTRALFSVLSTLLRKTQGGFGVLERRIPLATKAWIKPWETRSIDYICWSIRVLLANCTLAWLMGHC